MGNKQAPQSQSGEEEDRVTAITAAASTASLPGTPRATTSNYPPQENGEEGEEELPPLPPPMKPITEPILVASGTASSSAEESQGKRVCVSSAVFKLVNSHRGNLLISSIHDENNGRLVECLLPLSS